jgi:2-C-methyl-D-erythritol 4-phosphate cytidylyltransferase
MKKIAIIVGAGKGVRMNCETPKQYLMLRQLPVLAYSLRAFNTCEDIDQIILVAPKKDGQYCRDAIIAGIEMKKPTQIVSGGETRQDSVWQGLLAIDDADSIVAIHDAVRPFIEPRQITACIAGAIETGASMLAIPVSDTLKRVDEDFFVKTTVSRDELWLAQTPQAFRYDIIVKGHASAKKEGFCATDDASLVERLGMKVKVIFGSRRNFKITDPDDLAMAEAIAGSLPA